MELLISIATKAAEVLLEPMAAPIKRHANLVLHSKRTHQELQKEFKDLESVRNRVQNEVNQAKWKGEEINEEVIKWLEDVETITTDIGIFLANIPEPSTTCLKGPSCGRSYKLGKKAMKQKSAIITHLERGNTFSQVSHPVLPRGIELLSHDDFTAFPSVTLAFNEIMNSLKKDRTRMVGVLGMGGIGKTTLVKEVGRVAKDKNKFDQVIMAVVSQIPDVRRIQGQLGDMLGLSFSRETVIGRSGQLSDRIKKEKSVLIILDDIWSRIDLADIGIPFNDDHMGCKILLTTRREQVCTLMGCQEIVYLNLLNEVEASSLFRKYAGNMLKDPSTDTEMVAKELMGECDGLPLALVVVASALRDKTDLQDWKCALEKIKMSKLCEIENVDRNVYACIELSYEYLKGRVAKKCFLLCSLFPEDSEIDIGELANYAMGFGLFDDDGVDSFIMAKSQVESTLRDLKASCLLLKTDSMMKRVKMHDMVRDAALWITSKGDQMFLVPISSHYNWTKNKLDKVTAISLLACTENKTFPDKAECPSLKILLLAQKVNLTLKDSCFEAMTSLRVLDLTAKMLLDLVLPSSLQHLVNLGTLHLRRWRICGDTTMIGKLKKLEILSFSGSVIYSLPKEIGDLSELMFLDLSGCKELGSSYTEVQRRLSKLEIVHTPNMPMQIF